LTPSEIQWLQDHPDVSELGVSSLMYGRDSRDSKTFKLNLDGSLEEIVREDKKKDSPWKF